MLQVNQIIIDGNHGRFIGGYKKVTDQIIEI
jgi:hypothetical protein